MSLPVLLPILHRYGYVVAHDIKGFNPLKTNKLKLYYQGKSHSHRLYHIYDFRADEKLDKEIMGQ